ncbi:MAG TPA: IS1182 family transposase [Dehalococcoidia bacterium]|nr:IS1182 family transposase [Dehalococcoidia bacterium]
MAPPTRPEAARVLRPVREQIQWAPRDLGVAVPEDHPARAIWGLLEKLDLAAFYGSIKAVLDRPGRPTTDPQVLLPLWLLATVEGVGSARRLARLCQEHDAYRWLCGGVPINYHMLSDFRVAHQAAPSLRSGQALDDLLAQVVASLMAAGAVTLERVAQDGMRVRASAGAASFRRKSRLKECLETARAQVQRLAQEREHPDPGVSQRERAARERVKRVERALEYLPQVQAAKERQQQTLAREKREKVTEPRASTTDAKARIMKMPDGGFRPAYNAQLATDRATGIIVGVAVTPEGNDAGQAVPMEEQVVRRTGQHPEAYLMDGGFATREAITILEERGVTVYAPVRLPRNKPEEERHQARYGDSPQVAAWRERMATEEAKVIYKERGATAEWANAQVRLHGLSQFTVRGLAKVTTVLLLVAIAHDLLRWIALTT